MHDRRGGAAGDGTVFEIKKTAGGYASTPTTLATFGSANGETPFAGLLPDSDGDLFGTTSAGGVAYGGTVFEIAKIGGGYASTPTTVASLNDGFLPECRSRLSRSQPYSRLPQSRALRSLGRIPLRPVAR